MHQRKAVIIHTLGCKLNQAESEALARRFCGLGFEVIDDGAADIVVLNTCTVTHTADRKARQQVRALRETNPQARLIVTGCYAERAAKELQRCGADMVISNSDKLNIADIVAREGDLLTPGVNAVEAAIPGRVRSFLKIQDGCRNFCAYCIVPIVRSEIGCAGADNVITQASAREREGYREIVLTGTEIGSYRDGETGLGELIGRLLGETSVQRIHLSSLQPQHISGDLLGHWNDPRLVRHFHLALQSGCDATLKRMRRRYTLNDYSRAVESIRRRLPDAAVTTDVIVGFPGETAAEFDETYRFCKNIHFAAMHIFNYSPRPGTSAADMPGKIDEKTKKERSRLMLDLAAEAADSFAARFIGQTRSVLWENEVKAGCGIYSGLTDNYLRVYASSSQDLSNSIIQAKLVKPAGEMPGTPLKFSTRGNHGQIWSEIKR